MKFNAWVIRDDGQGLVEMLNKNINVPEFPLYCVLLVKLHMWLLKIIHADWLPLMWL
jgi:hypothetical protein